MRFLPAILLVALTALRLWTAAVLPLTPDEAFQWMCANQLDWAFFDGPAGTACLVKIGFLALGDDPLGLRLAFPLFAALATVAAFLVGRSLFETCGGFWTAAVLNIFPAFNLAAIHATPAAPFLAALLLATWSAIEAIQTNSSLRWLAAGAFAALAVQFSYLALLFVPAIFLAVAASAHRRQKLRHPGLYAASILAVAGTIPAMAWNQANGWPALGLATFRTLVSPRWNAIPTAFAESIGAVSASGAILILIVLALVCANARLHIRPRQAAALAAPCAAFWLLALLHGNVPTLVVLTAASVAILGAGHAAAMTRPLAMTLLVLVVVSAGFSSVALAQAGRATGIIPWRALAANVESLLAETQANRPRALFVIVKDTAFTAMLNYHLPKFAPGQPREVFVRESQDLSNQFGLWPRYDDFVETDTAPDEMFREHKAENPYLGRSALYITDERPEDLPQTITGGFATVTPLATMQAGERVLRAYLCEEYQTVPL